MHIKCTHQGVRDFLCSICGYAAHTQALLKRHAKIHSDKVDKSHMCSHCGKGFANNYRLKRHMRVHTGEKPHLCEECGTCFSQKGRLRHHRSTHHGGQEGTSQFICLTCQLPFNTSQQLDAHQVECTKGGVVQMGTTQDSHAGVAIEPPQQQEQHADSSAENIVYVGGASFQLMK